MRYSGSSGIEDADVPFQEPQVLHAAAPEPIASTSEELIRSVGFDIIHVPSKTLPNHYRIIHPDGFAGFNDQNLAQLLQVFVNTTGH